MLWSKKLDVPKSTSVRIFYIHSNQNLKGADCVKRLLDLYEDEQRVMKLASETIEAGKLASAKEILEILLDAFPTSC